MHKQKSVYNQGGIFLKLKRLIRIATNLVMGLILLYSSTYIVFTVIVNLKERELDYRWSQTTFALTEVPARYPNKAKNETAIFLEKMVAVNNNSFELKSIARAFPPFAGWSFEDEIKSPDNNFRLPASVHSYVARHREDYNALYEKVAQELPEWGVKIDYYLDDPAQLYTVYGNYSPELQPIITIIKLISLDAFDKTEQGRNAEALAAFECAWRINSPLRNHPTISGQLIALVCDASN